MKGWCVMDKKMVAELNRKTVLEGEDELILLKARDKLWFLGEVVYIFSQSKDALDYIADYSEEDKNESIIRGLHHILDETGNDITKILEKEWNRPIDLRD